MVVLIVVTVACFGAGVVAVSRYLPELADGPAGTLAFFVICGLSGAAVGLVGLHVYLTIRQLEETSRGQFSELVVADGLTSILLDSGTVAGLALIAYLLAPRQPSAASPSEHRPP